MTEPADLCIAKRCPPLAAGILPFAFAISACAQVEVTNPVSAPVLTSSINEPGRIPYQAAVVATVATQCNATHGNNISCPMTISSAPPGKRLVIKSLEARVTTSETDTPPVGVQIAITAPDTWAVFGLMTNIVFPTIGRFSVATFDTTIYLDPASSGSYTIAVNFTGPSAPLDAELRVTGYLLDCTAAPCNPIVSH